MTEKTVTLTDNATGKTVELPVLNGTMGPSAIDITRLFREFGYLTYDPGFQSTASCSSGITYIDGDEGPPGDSFPSLNSSPNTKPFSAI